MSGLRRHSYAALWTLMAVIVLALILLVFRTRLAPVEQIAIDPESYTPAAARLERERAEAGENPLLANPPDVTVKGTEIVLSSPNGELKMRLTSAEAFSKEGIVSLPQAEIEFVLGDQRKLHLLAEDLTYTLKEETAEVSGRLSGEIDSLGMRFTATGILWDQRSRELTLQGATLVDPAFNVEARDILVDVKNDTLQVLGGVRVNL